MKLELLFRPLVQPQVLALSFDREEIDKYSASRKTVEDVVDVLMSKFFAPSKHLHFVFYFHVPPDVLTEFAIETHLIISRDQYSHDFDEGLLSGSLENFYHAMLVFCRKEVAIELRLFFNQIGLLLEREGVTLPFIKLDLGDKTYAVRNK